MLQPGINTSQRASTGITICHYLELCLFFMPGDFLLGGGYQNYFIGEECEMFYHQVQQILMADDFESLVTSQS